ncbi:unnamed protein product [Amoebophrya sp. A25]|nr:unnamed protein product [Amoebophrya sp. A25]|eukprot:GSA25T00014155001.1
MSARSSMRRRKMHAMQGTERLPPEARINICMLPLALLASGAGVSGGVLPPLRSSVCVERRFWLDFSLEDIFCTLLVAGTAFLSAGSGVGGGGVFVPLFLMLLGFGSREAVPLSKACCLFGSSVNIAVFLRERNPASSTPRPKVDFDVVAVLNPPLLAGITLGVIGHKMAPEWFVVLLLLATLWFAFTKSYQKGMQRWRAESAELEAAAKSGGKQGEQGDVDDDPHRDGTKIEVVVDQQNGGGSASSGGASSFRCAGQKDNFPGKSAPEVKGDHLASSPSIFGAFGSASGKKSEQNRRGGWLGGKSDWMAVRTSGSVGGDMQQLVDAAGEESDNENDEVVARGENSNSASMRDDGRFSQEMPGDEVNTPPSSDAEVIGKPQFGGSSSSQGIRISSGRKAKECRSPPISGGADHRPGGDEGSSWDAFPAFDLQTIKVALDASWRDYQQTYFLARNAIRITLALCAVLFFLEYFKAVRCTGLYWLEVLLQLGICFAFLRYATRTVLVDAGGVYQPANEEVGELGAVSSAASSADEDEHTTTQPSASTLQDEESGPGRTIGDATTPTAFGISVQERNSPKPPQANNFCTTGEEDEAVEMATFGSDKNTTSTSRRLPSPATGSPVENGLERASLAWREGRNLVLFPTYAWVAGFVGGFLGIGGGMIISPVLLDLGLNPEVCQATTAMFVFLSSVLAVIQFFLLDLEMPAYLLWYGAWVTVATYVGQRSIAYMLRIYQRKSLIILSVAAIIFLSMLLMTLTGLRNLYRDLAVEGDWESLAFSFQKFCH